MNHVHTEEDLERQTVLLPAELAAWAKSQPGGLSATCRAALAAWRVAAAACQAILTKEWQSQQAAQPTRASAADPPLGGPATHLPPRVQALEAAGSLNPDEPYSETIPGMKFAREPQSEPPRTRERPVPSDGWTCAHCGRVNRDGLPTCVNCRKQRKGAGRTPPTDDGEGDAD